MLYPDISCGREPLMPKKYPNSPDSRQSRRFGNICRVSIKSTENICLSLK